MPAQSVHSLLGRPQVGWIPESPSSALVMPQCYFGIEMELEAPPSNANPLTVYRDSVSLSSPLVSAVNDGSLRNGIELVFSRPLMGEQALNAIDHMYRAREELGLVGSIRTSTHVHVNFSEYDDTLDTLRSTVLAYLLIERAMAVTAGPHREHNTYCPPTYVQSPSTERCFHLLATSGNQRDSLDYIRELSGDNNRYSAMNIGALYRHGTIEFRQLGTVPKEQLLLWINMLLALKLCGRTYSGQQLLSEATSLDQFVRTFLGEAGQQCLVINDEGRTSFDFTRQRLIGVMPSNAVSRGSEMNGVFDTLSTTPQPFHLRRPVRLTDGYMQREERIVEQVTRSLPTSEHSSWSSDNDDALEF